MQKEVFDKDRASHIFPEEGSDMSNASDRRIRPQDLTLGLSSLQTDERAENAASKGRLPYKRSS